jgi:hypothetical protein
MSEQARERVYWYISLGFLILAAIAAYRLYSADFQPMFFSAIERKLIPVLFIGSLPLALVTDLLIAVASGQGKSLRFWLPKPSTQCQYVVRRRQCTAVITDRLEKLGFNVRHQTTPAGIEYLDFQKAKSEKVYTFLENGFFGRVELSPTPVETAIRTKLTFDDTVIFDTGELTELRQLAEYISLKVARLEQFSKLSIMSACGLAMAYVTVLLSLCVSPAIAAQRAVLTSFANAAILMLVAALVITVMKRPALIGIRSILIGLGLAMMPYLAWILAGLGG